MRRQLEGLLTAGETGMVLSMAQSYFEREPLPDPTEAVWVAILACKAAGQLGKWGEAVMWAERGMALNPGADDEAMAWLQFRLGTATMFVGDVYRSHRTLASFVEQASRNLTLASLVPRGVFNMGFVARLMRRFDDEVTQFRKAERLFRAGAWFEEMLLSQAELTWTYLMAKQVAAAQEELERFDLELAHHPEAEASVYRWVNWAYYYHLQGEMAESNRLCQEGLAHRPLTSGQKADLLWILAMNARDHDPQAARQWADEAYEEALRDWWPLQIERVEQLRSSLQHTEAGR